MGKISSLFDWQIFLLISPMIMGITLFCFLLWSDNRRDKRQRQKKRKRTKCDMNNQG